MIAKLQRAVSVLARRGPGYGLYLIRGVVAPRLSRAMLRGFSRRGAGTVALIVVVAVSHLIGTRAGVPLVRLVSGIAIGLLILSAVLKLVRSGWSRWRARTWAAEARALASTAATSTDSPATISWSSWEVSDATRAAVESVRSAQRSDGPSGDDFLLGRIERDGLLATDFGQFPGFETVASSSFRARDRFDLDLVLVDDQPLIRKGFRGDSMSLAREWLALERLRGKARVPIAARALPEKGVLYRTLVPGQPLNDLLVAAGAEIREIQIEASSQAASATRLSESGPTEQAEQAEPAEPAALAELAEQTAPLDELDAASRIGAVLARGRRVLDQVVSETFFAALEWEIDRIHQQGVTGLSLTFGNLTVDDEARPWLFDFDRARIHSSTSSATFELARDRDRVKYNQIFDRSIVTEASARATLRQMSGGYSPVDLGRGLVSRGFWSIDSGTGRWEYLNGPALGGLLQGARVLDLGSHNGIMPLLMLREGARAVVGIEQDPQRVEQAQRMRKLLEWRAMHRFDFTIHTGDMRIILDQDFGSFDAVTAFCSLYYLSEDDMGRMVERAAELAPTLILQAKTDTRSEAGDNKAEKSSLAFLTDLMRDHGFLHVETIAPKGFHRPLLIGRRTG